MADTVRYLMEGMLEELDAYENLGWFSKEEIQKIVKQRTDHEYKLKRRAALKSDFLQYIEYEKKVEKLRKLRKDKNKGKNPSGVSKGKKDKHEGYIVRRIHFIYERAFRKFWGDLRLWMNYFEFCKEINANKAISKALTRCLQLHPNEPSVWSYAASWEFESRRNVQAARALMQRGLRNCKKSEEMWLEYFKMELLYALKLRKRREILGLESQDDDQNVTMSSVMDGAVACIVYSNASSAMELEPESHLKYLRITRETGEFPVVSKFLEEKIYARFPASEAVWEYRALNSESLSTSQSSDANISLTEKTMEVFELAIAAVPTPKMYLSYVTYLKKNISMWESKLVDCDGHKVHDFELQIAINLRALDDVYNKALSSLDCSPESSDLVLSQIGHFMRCGRHSLAVSAAERCCALLPKQASSWISNLQAQHRMLCLTGVDSDKWQSCLMEVMRNAAKMLPTKDSLEFWQCALRLWSGSNLSPFSFNELLENKLMDSEGETLASVAASCVSWIWMYSGPLMARQVYDRWTGFPGAGISLFLSCLQLEMSLKHGRDEARICRLLARAEDLHGHDHPELWLFQSVLDRSQGRGPSSAYRRAQHQLLQLERLDSALRRID